MRAFENEKQILLMKRYEFHPLSQSLPLMREPDFSEFMVDIKAHGQIAPIGLLDGKILDGRNRYLACQKLGIEARFVTLCPKDAKAYVTSMNVHRRQLSREERQQYVMRLIAQQDKLQMTNKEVAQASGVSERTVRNVKDQTAKKGGFAVLSDKKRKKIEEEKNTAPEDVIVDDHGTPVPKGAAQAYWARKSEAMNVLNQIRAARQVKRLRPEEVMWCECNLNGVLADLSSAMNRFSSAVPAYVCPYCKGIKTDSCKGCKGRGVVSKFMWSMIPEELRKMRETKGMLNGRMSS